MDTLIKRYCLSLVLVAAVGTKANQTATLSPEAREPRVNGRIVKLYSGPKPDQFHCSYEGFQIDPNNCAAFYRCVRERSGKFTVFRYQCAPGTVYDPDVETCNHPRNTRRSECGGFNMPKKTTHTPHINEIEGALNEFPQPINTKLPVFTLSTLKPSTSFSMLSTDLGIKSTTMPSEIMTSSLPTILKLETVKPSISTTKYPWSETKSYQDILRKTTQQPKDNDNDACSTDGFMGDSDNCRKFYRCVGNQRGGYIRYEFSCSETTIWDDEIQGCNHPWAVKRSKCGRSLTNYDNSNIKSQEFNNALQEYPTTDLITSNGFGYKSNKTVQQQLQISHGDKVTQTQTQISNSNEVIQNQTQINYGDRVKQDNNNKSRAKQNQTQISYGSAVSQTQIQIDYGHEGIQTQLQIDHSKDASQSQVQIQESTTTVTSSTLQNTEKESTTNNKCSQSGFMGDSNNCKKFYRCVDSGRGTYTRFEYTCGDGTLWDKTIQACNHAWVVKDCNGNGSIASTNYDVATSTIKLTSIVNQIKTTQSYSTTQSADIDDIDVGYGDSNNQESSSPIMTITSTSTTTTKVPKEVNSECTISGFVGDPNDCKIFYRCVENGNGFTKYEFKCGDGTVWDPNIEACNHAWAVKSCSVSGATSTERVEITTSTEVKLPSDTVQTSVTLIQITTQTPTQNINDYDTGYGSQNQQSSSSSIKTTVTPQIHNDKKGNKCSSSGFMGDVNDCKKFYRCVDDGHGGYIRHDFSCGEGTVWDSKIESCNHAWAVEKCGGASSSEPTHDYQQATIQEIMHDDNIDNGYATQSIQTSQTIQSSTSSSSATLVTSESETSNLCNTSGFIGDKKDCKKFYRCVDNGNGGFNQYEFVCGDGTVWDESIESCNHAWVVKNCGNNTMLSQNDSSTQSLLVSSQMENTEYTQVPSKTTTTEKYDEIELSDASCSQEGFFGNKKDCKKFYRCVDNGIGGYTKYEFICGDGTEWKQEIQACDHVSPDKTCKSDLDQKPTSLNDDMTNEITKATTSSGQSQTSQATSELNQSINQVSQGKCESEGFYGEPTNCKKFYRCVANGKGDYTKYEFTCGDGTVWNQEIQACDHESDDYTCLSSSPSLLQENQSESTTLFSTTKEQPTTDSYENIQITGSNQCTSDGFFAHPNNCKKFIRCVDNGNKGFTRYEFSCGDGTVWVQEIQACDHDTGDTKCSNQTETTSKPQISEENQIESVSPNKENDDYDPGTTKGPSQDKSNDCTVEGYFGDTNDCKKFYRCVDNGNGGYIKHDFVCGEGTAWDSDIQTCNHISEVSTCSNNNQQDDTDITTEKNVSQTESSTNSSQESISESDSDNSKPNNNEVCEKEGYFGDSKNCKKFYRCVDNGNGGLIKYDFTCGDGTIWDQDITTCNHPQDVSKPSCNDSNDGSSSTSSSMGSSTGLTTSSTTDSNSSTSDNNQNSSDSSGEASKKPANQNVTCDKAGYYPNPNDCKKFYRCVDWDGDGQRFSVFHFECGEGTIWDPALDTCNHEDSVYPPRDCSGTQSQNTGQEITTTQESTATEQTTTQESISEPATSQSYTSEQTTEQTSEQTTTQQSTTIEPTTTSDKTTTEETTTSEKTTTQESTTTKEDSTTQQSTTSGPTTTQKSTTNQQTTSDELTTTQQTTTTDQTITEQSTTEHTTTAKSTTNDQTTQQSSTTDQSNEQTTQDTNTTEKNTSNTEESTEQFTTDSNTAESQSTTDSSISTTESEAGSTTEESTSSDKECPETDNDQYLLVCPTSFKRHPKYCNMFYQCIEDDETYEAQVAMFKCPNNTIYDESQTQCVEESKAVKKCDGEIANKRRFKRLGLYNREPITADRGRQSCSAAGYFSFEKRSECSKGFLKCEKSKNGKLRGFVYQCPEGYIYWSISKRCEFIADIRDCKLSDNDWSGRWNIPVERKNLAFRN